MGKRQRRLRYGVQELVSVEKNVVDVGLGYCKIYDAGFDVLKDLNGGIREYVYYLCMVMDSSNQVRNYEEDRVLFQGWVCGSEVVYGRSSIFRWINILVGLGVLTESVYRGVYVMNPLMFWRGSEDDRFIFVGHWMSYLKGVGSGGFDVNKVYNVLTQK